MSRHTPRHPCHVRPKKTGRMDDYVVSTLCGAPKWENPAVSPLSPAGLCAVVAGARQCHAVSSCCLHISSRIQSCLKTQAKWQPLQLAPFPEKLYLVPSKAVGFKMAGSSGLKMAIRKELTVESDPKMRSRPLRVNDYDVLPWGPVLRPSWAGPN